MKKWLPGLLLALLLTGCREVAFTDREYQTFTVDNFSGLIRTTLPALNKNVHSLTIKVDGTINQPVTLQVTSMRTTTQPAEVQRIQLEAGSYRRRVFQNDFYENAPLALQVIAPPGTTGALTIEWYRSTL